MKNTIALITLVSLAGTASAQTLDDLSIATLFAGSNVAGDTSTSSNDMSGSAISTTGSWSGGDDVYTLDWAGGDLTVDLFFTHADGDLDLFLIQNPLGGSSLATGLTTTDNEQVNVAGLASGTYYLVVDGWQGANNAYNLTVVPAPGVLALVGLGGLAAGRRRR